MRYLFLVLTIVFVLVSATAFAQASDRAAVAGQENGSGHVLAQPNVPKYLYLWDKEGDGSTIILENQDYPNGWDKNGIPNGWDKDENGEPEFPGINEHTHRYHAWAKRMQRLFD